MRIIRTLVLLTIILGAAAVGYFLGTGKVSGTRTMESGASQDAVASDPNGQKILYWYDPMVPDRHFDKPGKSPFMDMQLVPKYATGGDDGNGIVISPRVSQNMGVRTAQVEKGILARRVDTVGYVRPDEHRIQVVQTRAAGWVERLYVRALNDPVSRGQLLAEIYSPDVLAAEEEYLVALKTGGDNAFGKQLAAAARRKLILLGMGTRQIEQIEKSGMPSRHLAVYAPIDGVVTDLGAREGSAVSPATPLFSLLNLDTVWVTAEIPEAQAGWAADGDTAVVHVPAFPGTVFEGKASYVYPQLSAATRTLQVRVKLQNRGLQLKPGMFANVTLKAEGGAPALLVPTEAVIATGKRTVVIVAEGGGKFVPVDVQTGREADGKTEILAGLSDGQTVVTSSQFLIDSEASLSQALPRLAPAPKATPPNQPSQSPHSEDGKTYSGVGTINKVDRQAGTVNITHGPIAGLGWPGMTMDFAVSDKALMESLKPGDHVEFVFRESPDGQYSIVRVMPR